MLTGFERMDTEQQEVGDLCFAHVRSHPWWPARIVDRVLRSKSKEMFQVVFFGTGETAWLPMTELKKVTVENLEVEVTPTALKRKKYKEGLTEYKSVLCAEEEMNEVRDEHEFTSELEEARETANNPEQTSNLLINRPAEIEEFDEFFSPENPVKKKRAVFVCEE